MIQLITGVPGSGKTCLALKLITDKYFFYDSRHGNFYLKPENLDITIITNIDGLKLPHINIDTLFREHKLDFERFFDYDYQKKVSSKYPKIIYILDEAQQYLSRKLRSVNTTLYFDMHRHLDHQIYLITQDWKKIHSDITSLTEFEYRLTKRTFSIAGEFRYLVKSSGTVFESRSFRPPKHIFKIYKSFTGNDNQPKRKNPIVKYIAVPLVLFLVVGIYFYTSLIPDSDNVSVGVPSAHASVKKSIPVPVSSDLLKIPIENKILQDGKIKLFQCPFTGDYTTIAKYPFPVTFSPGKGYFISASESAISLYLSGSERLKRFLYVPPPEDPPQPVEDSPSLSPSRTLDTSHT